MKTNRVIIAGSRDCPEYNVELFRKIDNILGNIGWEDLEIVSGTCRGADKLGENYADLYGQDAKQFPADWKTHGKSAGYIRNKQMAEYATHLIALWDGQSKGTKNMIDLAKQYGLNIRIINFKTL